MVTSATPPTHHLKCENSKNSMNFFSHTIIITTSHCLSAHTQNIVTRYLRQSASFDVLGYGSPNYRSGAKSGQRRHFGNNEKNCTKNMLIWWNETYPEAIKLRKMSDSWCRV